ncbi:hypothetical protein JCM33774_64540 [Actinophytocola sp. KF-1]
MSGPGTTLITTQARVKASTIEASIPPSSPRGPVAVAPIPPRGTRRVQPVDRAHPVCTLAAVRILVPVPHRQLRLR